MIKDQNKTKRQLIDELIEARLRVHELERSQTDLQSVAKELCEENGIPALVLNNNLMGIAFVRNRKFEWVNPKFHQLLGMSLDQVVGSSTRVMYSSEDIYEENGRAIYTALSRGEWFELTLDVSRADTVFKARIIGKAPDPSLPQEGSIWIFEDITDRKLMEETLRESEEKYRTVVEKANEGIVIAQDDCFTYVNPKMADDILGVPVEELIGRPFGGFIHAEDRDMVVGRYRRRLAGESLPDAYEFRIIGKNESVKWVRLASKQVHWKGRPATINMYTDVTDRKQAEETLRESEEKYRTVVEKANEGIVIIQDGCFTYVNPKVADDLLGASIEELVGQPFSGFVHPEDRNMVVNRNQRRLAGENVPDAYEFRIIGKNKKLKWLYVSAKRIQWKGRPSTINMFTDITGRKLAEEALKESENWYRAIFENTGTAMLISDEDTTIVLANAEFENLSGYSADELAGKKSWTDFIDRDDVEEMIKNHRRRRIDPGAVPKNYEFRFWNRKGHVRNIFLTVDLIPGTKRSVASLMDITARKEMENDLRKSEERLRGIVETSNAGIMMITQGGGILYANQQIAGMMGYDFRTFMDKSYYDYVHPEEKGAVIRNIYRIVSGEVDSLSAERRYVRSDGTELCGYVSGGRLQVAAGQYQIVLVISDITPLKLMEKEKKHLEDHLRQAQKMEAIGTLAGGIAHDFNNILASMLGFTEMASLETREDVRRKYHDRVLQACGRAKNLVNQILSFSRDREQECRPLEVKPILKEALTLLRATLPTTIEIRQDMVIGEAAVLVDPTQIHQIIMNLCTNAAHAMRDRGGLLDVCLSGIDIPHPERSPRPGLPAGSYVVLSVRDTGQGIEPAIKDKIFDPFFTTKKAKEGTGLGLSVVYGIVKNCGGAIDVQSTVGQGATFTIYLPRVSRGNSPEEENRVKIDLRGNERILFVDDEEALVNMAQVFFEALGYSITATTSSAQALLLFQKDPGAFDLVITDMTMPELTGADLARALLKIRPELPIILCTGYSHAIDMDLARKLNIREFVLKPISLDDLGLLVRRVLKN